MSEAESAGLKPEGASRDCFIQQTVPPSDIGFELSNLFELCVV